MTIDREKLEYRECAGIFLINTKKEVFVGQRMDRISEAWQMPQGGIEEGEEILEAAHRELKEEIGTDNIEVIKESQYWHNYEIPDNLIEKFWGGRYRGQTQKWILAKFLGSDDEINIMTKEPEFADWKWVDRNELPDVIVRFKRDLYLDILKEFEPIIKEL